MELNGVEIEDTYCEAFGGFFTRILITAKNERWLRIAAQVTTGYGTSTIHCDAEAGIDLELTVLQRYGSIDPFSLLGHDCRAAHRLPMRMRNVAKGRIPEFQHVTYFFALDSSYVKFRSTIQRLGFDMVHLGLSRHAGLLVGVYRFSQSETSINGVFPEDK